MQAVRAPFRNPVGPQPPSVYWRGRLVLGLGWLAVIISVVLIGCPLAMSALETA